ncbi:hypothetical protein M0805_005138 [Coniferiporia weirii]|nr:hypothetical protein M0805_005138 [Coniferiporia weirii]
MSDMRPDNFGRWHRDAHYFHHRPRHFRCFPRIFWFALGAGAFAMWSQCHRERKQHYVQEGADKRGHCGWSRPYQRQYESPERDYVAPGAFPAPTSLTAAPAVSSSPTMVPASTPAQATAPGESTTPLAWHPEDVREVGKHVSNAMADMSESALDQLMTSIQALKSRISEAREMRERERLHHEQRIPAENSERQDKDTTRRLV